MPIGRVRLEAKGFILKKRSEIYGNKTEAISSILQEVVEDFLKSGRLQKDFAQEHSIAVPHCLHGLEGLGLPWSSIKKVLRLLGRKDALFLIFH